MTDFVSVRGDMIGVTSPGWTLSGFDVGGNLLVSNTVQDIGGIENSIAFAGIHAITISGTGTTAYDDLTFNPLVAASAPSVVPLPPALLLFASALVGIGGYARLRRR